MTSVVPHVRAAVLLLTFAIAGTPASAEILIRWDHPSIPPREALGIDLVVVPASSAALVRQALARGYRVMVEIDAAAVPGFASPAEGLAGAIVRGAISPKQVLQLRQQLKSPAARVQVVERQGKWPHIRTNWVTRRGEVLQVSSPSAQPWIENNAALLRLPGRGDSSILTYPWQPITLAEVDGGPALENYLVAIAEAGTFGGDLLLPLAADFQRSLALAEPQARILWNEIRRHAGFYAWDLPGSYTPVANIGVVTADPAAWFEVMNLLARHNLPFAILPPADLGNRDLSRFALLLAMEPLDGAQREALARFAGTGGTVVIDRPAGSLSPEAAAVPGGQLTAASAARATYTLGAGGVVEVRQPISDPNAFALEVRQLLGRDRRAIDIWNGLTVLTALYAHPDGKSLLVTALNYAHQPLPVQVRVRGTYAVVRYESPDEPLALLPCEHRDGGTEFTLPALRAGARVFLEERRDRAP